MSGFQPDPIRWKERQDQSSLAEREAGRAIRFMPTPEPLPAAQLTRIALRIRSAGRRRRTRWLAVTAGLILSGATVAFAAHLIALPGWLAKIENPRQTDAPPRQEVSPNTQAPHEPDVERSHAALPIPVSPPVSVTPQAPRKPARRTSDRATRVAWLEASQPTPGASNSEGPAQNLSEALHALRVERSPGTALFLLDHHATELGKSAFAHEALLLRVEAMLALHRKDEVLRLLDGVALTDVAASRSLLITRGELRAAANRCAEGIADFNGVLAKSKQADSQALFGRALCRKKLGDSTGAQADVERYRHEFPTDPRLPDLDRQLAP